MLPLQFDVRQTSAGPAPIPFRTHAPMKLLYVWALALQILLPRQINPEASRTGRRPNEVLTGTLAFSSVSGPDDCKMLRVVPNEVAKPQNQNRDSGELQHARQIRVKRLDELRDHRSQWERSKSLCERNGCRASHGWELPSSCPVLCIMASRKHSVREARRIM